MLDKPTSFSNKLILEAFKSTGVRADISHGWAKVGQKKSLKGLTVLFNAKLANGTEVLKGSTAYIKEEYFNSELSKDIRVSDLLQIEHIVVNIDQIEYIEPPKGESA